MYTIEKLIEDLKQYPKDMKVAINHNISEDQAMLIRLERHTIDNAPYCKGDDIWSCMNVRQDEEVLFLEGGI